MARASVRIDQNGRKIFLFREHVVNQPVEKRWNAAARGSSTTVNNDWSDCTLQTSRALGTPQIR
jgi:hypothetical protein